MRRSLVRIAFTLSLIVLFAQCGTSDNRPGEQAEIPASDTTVTFAGTTWSDVVFKHAEHSDRYHGECIKCHDHEPIAGETHWYCRSCHTAGQDRENLCNEVSEHGCVMTQCHNCHEVQGANPGQKCTDCHKGGMAIVYEGVIDTASKVDKWPITFSQTGNLIIEVKAYEGCGGQRSEDYFGDGPANNQLVANIFLFKVEGTLLTLIDSATGMYPGGSHIPHKEPYLVITDVSPGSYVLAIGSADLSEADARAGVNTDGSLWTDSDNGTTLYNKYKIKIYFN